jgi:predicted transcriptional regulator
MVTIQLDNAQEERLRALAAGQGRDPAELARRVIEDYLDFQAASHDTPENWAEASVAMTSEFMRPQELAELRGKLVAWEDDWNAPGMDAYDAM